MAPETSSSAAGTAPAKSAVWPWLLVPVVALVLFFTLRAVRSAPDASGAPAPVQAASPATPAP